MNATGVTAGPAESNGRLLLSKWRDSLHVTCGLTACTPGSAPGPTLGNEYGKTLPFLPSKYTQPFYGPLSGTRRNVHPLTLILVIRHPLSTSSIDYDPQHPLCSIYIRAGPSFSTTSLQVLFGLLLGLEPSTPYLLYCPLYPVKHRKIGVFSET